MISIAAMAQSSMPGQWIGEMMWLRVNMTIGPTLLMYRRARRTAMYMG